MRIALIPLIGLAAVGLVGCTNQAGAPSAESTVHACILDSIGRTNADVVRQADPSSTLASLNVDSIGCLEGKGWTCDHNAITCTAPSGEMFDMSREVLSVVQNGAK